MSAFDVSDFVGIVIVIFSQFFFLFYKFVLMMILYLDYYFDGFWTPDLVQFHAINNPAVFSETLIWRAPRPTK